MQYFWFLYVAFVEKAQHQKLARARFTYKVESEPKNQG